MAKIPGSFLVFASFFIAAVVSQCHETKGVTYRYWNGTNLTNPCYLQASCSGSKIIPYTCQFGVAQNKTPSAFFWITAKLNDTKQDGAVSATLNSTSLLLNTTGKPLFGRVTANKTVPSSSLAKAVSLTHKLLGLNELSQVHSERLSSSVTVENQSVAFSINVTTSDPLEVTIGLSSCQVGWGPWSFGQEHLSFSVLADSPNNFDRTHVQIIPYLSSNGTDIYVPQEPLPKGKWQGEAELKRQCPDYKLKFGSRLLFEDLEPIQCGQFSKVNVFGSRDPPSLPTLVSVEPWANLSGVDITFKPSANDGGCGPLTYTATVNSIFWKGHASKTGIVAQNPGKSYRISIGSLPSPLKENYGAEDYLIALSAVNPVNETSGFTTMFLGSHPRGNKKKDKLSTGALVGIIIGSVAFTVFIGVLLCLCVTLVAFAMIARAANTPETAPLMS